MVDEAKGLAKIHGKDVIVLRQARDPKDIPWREYGVTLVVDCTGKFRDPVRRRQRRRKGRSGATWPPEPGRS